jgi:predicted NUDIX family NTP pyrophosphohydrolase
MPKLSAGLLLFRRSGEALEVMLVHMGGPLWRNKDLGGWSIPKGEYEEPDDPLSAARREFAEEIGAAAPSGEAIDLGSLRQPSGKIIRAWAIEADMDVSKILSNTFEMEWPPRSGRIAEFPEVDRAGWFEIGTAREKLVRGQQPFLDRVVALASIRH